MTKYQKGLNTRLEILEKARKILNEKGIWITQDTLVREMNLSKSRVTNHFPTKESLFIAILTEYETEMQAALKNMQNIAETVGFPEWAFTLSRIMDIQYAYRCGMAYISLTSASQTEFHLAVSQKYKKNLEAIHKRITMLVEKGLLNKQILIPEELNLFCTHYIHFMTTWNFSLELYRSKEGYRKMKPVYLECVFRLVGPYLTAKGKTQMDTIDFKKLSHQKL